MYLYMYVYICMKVGSYVRTYGAKCAKRNNQQMHMDMWNETEIKVAEHMSTDM
jgi:Zn ribbon nucleic-acid-binding protein